MLKGIGGYIVLVPSERWRSDLVDDWNELQRVLDLEEGQLARGVFQDGLFKLLLEWRRNKHAFADAHRDLSFDDVPTLAVADV